MKDTHAQALERIRELIEAATVLHKNGGSIPSMVLAYSTIDIMGSLLRPDPNSDAKGSDFQKWVSDFMLPGSNLEATAVDLWAARCGFLHCLSPYSNISRSGKAKEICYALTSEVAEVARAAAKRAGKDVIVIYVPDFLRAFIIGAQRFAVAVDQDPDVRKLFDANAKGLFDVL